MNKYDENQLVQLALKARERAYAPYSGFAVGAALLAESGKIYLGCNVENATYGATICAERTAVSSAVAAGERKFHAIAIAGSGEGVCTPCGICRQVLCEFSPEMDVLCVCGKEGSRWERYSADQLLPGRFSL